MKKPSMDFLRKSHYDKGALIYSEQESAIAIYFIKTGKVNEGIHTVQGKRISSIYGVGDFFGEGCLTHNLRNSYAIALEPVELIWSLRGHFEYFIGNNPSVSKRFYKALVSKIAEERPKTLKLEDARRRFEIMLIHYAWQNFPDVDKDIDVTFKNEFFSQLIGSGVHTVVSQLQNLVKEGLLAKIGENKNRRILIPELEALVEDSGLTLWDKELFMLIQKNYHEFTDTFIGRY